MTSPMSQPFVYPIGRDFCPRLRLEQRSEHGKVSLQYVPAEVVDAVSYHRLLSEGLQRNLSIFTTHTVCTHDLVRKDSFFLENPLIGIKIPCRLGEISYRGGTEKLHRLAKVDYEKIPEKLWHAYRNHLYSGDLRSDLTILILDFALQVKRESLAKLPAAFKKKRFNTLPLHLVHRWTYKNTTRRPTDEETIPPGWAEEQTDTPVLNVWKDFVIVTREESVKHITLGVASDFHYSDRNDYVRANYPGAENIHGKLKKFAAKAFGLWERGELDYLVMNGDFVDYAIPERVPDSGFPPPLNWPDYDHSNWQRFEEIMGLNMASKKLMSIPIIWNAGDHDRLITGSELPLPLGSSTPQNQDELNAKTRSYHYNYYGTGYDDSRAINEHTRIEQSYIHAPVSYTGPLRWVYERARIADWPLHINFMVGSRTFRIHILDTGGVIPYQSLQALRSCEGISTLAGSLDTVESKDFTVIITHSPPVSVDPADAFFGQQQQFFLSPESDEATYGSFVEGRDAILKILSDHVKEKRPTLVVSGHVHFREAYFLSDSGAAGGTAIWDEIEGLNRETIPPDSSS